MSQRNNREPGPVGRLVVSAGIAYALYHFPLETIHDPLFRGLWWFGAGCVALGMLLALPQMGGGFGWLWRMLRLMRRDTVKGSAGFMTEREARQAGLHRRRKGSRMVGILGRVPLWLRTEVHHLILGPSGSSKTSAAIINILMGASESALITDIKGELFEVTADHRRKAFGHDVLKIDPKDPANSARINPLDDIDAAITADSPKALTRARGMAAQLLPDPEGGGGANAVFYQGGRALIVTVILAVLVVLPKEHRTLAMVYRALSDMRILHDLLEAASEATALNGEIADMARSAHTQAFDDDGTSKTFDSFRTSAILAMEAFGPGNYLAAITSDSTFHFSELKQRKLSVYILIDYANAGVLGAFSGLLQHMAADAMVEDGTKSPVLFCLDEFCNQKFEKLPTVLTLLRSAGVRVVLATQDLGDIERVYSKHALETVLSETEIKQFLGGIRSRKTLDWLAGYLGETSEALSSYSLGREGPQESLSRVNRKLLNDDEIRRLPKDAQLIFHGNHKPILALKVPVFAIAPWRSQLAVNSAYGSTLRLDPVMLRISWWGSRVTRRAARAHARMLKSLHRKRGQTGLVLAQLFGGIRLVPMLVLAAIIALTLDGPGLPNLRVSYGYSGSTRQQPLHYTWCRYVGPTSPGQITGPNCPLILWRKP